MLQQWLTVFVAVVIRIIAGDVVAGFAITAAAFVVLTAVAIVAANVATTVAAVVAKVLQQ